MLKELIKFLYNIEESSIDELQRQKSFYKSNWETFFKGFKSYFDNTKELLKENMMNNN